MSASDERSGAPPQSVLHGALFMIVAVGCFTTLDAILKLLAQRHDPIFLAWGRNFFQVVYIMALIPLLGARRILHTRRWWLHILRGGLLLATTVLIVMAFRYMPMTQTYAITFSLPLFATILAAIVLGERPSPARWLFIVTGFAGVLVAIQPGAPDAGLHLLYPLGMAIANAVFQVLTRYGQDEEPLAMLFYVGLFALIFATPPQIWTWSAMNAGEWGLLAIGGVFGTLAHLCLIAAFRRAPTAVVSPMLYAQIIYASIIGYVVFSEIPTAATAIGGLIVAASGFALIRLKR